MKNEKGKRKKEEGFSYLGEKEEGFSYLGEKEEAIFGKVFRN